MSANTLAQEAKRISAQFATVLNNQHETKAKYVQELVDLMEKIQKATDVTEMQKQIDQLEEEIRNLKLANEELERELGKAEDLRAALESISSEAGYALEQQYR